MSGSDGRTVQVVRADERYVSQRDGVTTSHSFSYGDHYDPDNVAFGPLVAVNEERVAAGAGYDSHHHADVEIVTWVLDGALHHEDSTGTRGTVWPGQVQHVSARSGIDHTERNASDDEPLRFLQMMVAPSEEELAAPDAGPPVYRQDDLRGARGYLVEACRVRDGVVLLAALLDEGDLVTLPDDGALHVQVSRGAVQLEGGDVGRRGLLRRRRGPVELVAGDVARITGRGAVAVRAAAPSEILAWHLSAPA